MIECRAIVVTPDDDDALVAAIEKGLDEAKSAFCELFGPRLRRFAWHRRLPIDDIDDLVQDTLLAALRQLQAGKFERKAKLATWVQAIFDRRVQDLLRRRSKSERRLVSLEETTLDSPKNRETILHRTPDQEIGLNVREVLAGMPFRERLVLLLSLQDGYRAHEIARLLGLKPKTAQGVLTSAKKRFRQLLSGAQENPPLPRLKGKERA